MTRWRYTVWLKDRPEVKVRKHRQSDCGTCVAVKCCELAAEIAAVWHVGPEGVAWTIEKLTGVVDGWSIVGRSETARIPERHWHARRGA